MWSSHGTYTLENQKGDVNYIGMEMRTAGVRVFCGLMEY